MLALRSYRRATTETDAPGASASATIRRFSVADQWRRRRRPFLPEESPASSPTDISDRVHYRLSGHDHRVDTIAPISGTRSRRVQAAQAGGIRPKCERLVDHVHDNPIDYLGNKISVTVTTSLLDCSDFESPEGLIEAARRSVQSNRARDSEGDADQLMQ
jgi:hypothetical protein